MPRAALKQVSTGYTLPAPTGGLNTRDALANMPESDAVILDNWFPQPTWVELRNGATTLATFTGACETVAAYAALNPVNNQLYGAVNNAGTRSLYRVDNAGGGAVGAPVAGGAGSTIQTITSTRYDWAQYSIGSVNYLYLVNGVDNPLLYNGSSWMAVTGISSPAITGVTTSTLATVAVYKQRLWFTDGSMKVWYLPQNSVGGAAIGLDMGPNFKLGGYIQAIVTVSIDNAGGTNDYIAFVSNVGEVVMFQGYDPSSVNTWFEAAHFRMGAPVATGRRTWQKMGADAVLITADGFIRMSDALLTDRSQTTNAVSDKIRKSVQQDIIQYTGNFGWQILLHPGGNKLLVNVPTVSSSSSYLYVMNTLAPNPWCTFGKYNSSWNSICLETQGNNLYAGAIGKVAQIDTGLQDFGGGITGYAQQAYSYFNMRGMFKQWTMCRPIFVSSGNASVALRLSIDYDKSSPSGSIPISSGNEPLWSANNSWTAPTYWGDAQTVVKNWYGVTGVGYSAGLQLQTTGSNVSLQWQSTDYVFQGGGLFG